LKHTTYTFEFQFSATQHLRFKKFYKISLYYLLIIYLTLQLNAPTLFSSFSPQALPLSALRLVVPPLRLMSAFLWQVIQRRNVTQYGKLEQFVMLVTETVPDIMSRSLVNKLIFHLRKKVNLF